MPWFRRIKSMKKENIKFYVNRAGKCRQRKAPTIQSSDKPTNRGLKKKKN